MKPTPAHRQEHVETVILEVLERGRVMTTQDVTKATKARLDLEPADLVRANKRSNEAKIDQIIANALQEKRNLCRNEFITRTGRGEFRITANGLRHLAKHRETIAEMKKLLEQIAPNAEWD